MGKHGIKTGAAKAAEKQARPAWTGEPPWERKGLTRAGRVIKFCECLPVSSGIHAGRRLKLRPWQKEIIKGIYRTVRGKRVVRQAVISTPRKNGKTSLSAALALAHLIGPECEERGQIYSAAADRNQAALLYREMEAIVLRVPAFAERCNIRAFTKEIIDEETGSVYTALSSDARKSMGLNVSFFCFDELAQSKSRDLFDGLQTGMGARKEPLGIVISTQSPNPNHVMSELVDYAQDIETGKLPPDESFYGKIYCADDDCDPWAKETWYAANPALDDFRSLEELEKFAEQAQKLPQKEAVFKSLYLNMRVETEAHFVTTEAFESCVGDIPDLSHRKVFVGLDLSSVADLTAAVIIQIPEGDEPFYVIPFAWVPGKSIRERSKVDRVPYDVWRKQGFIEQTPGGVVNYSVILEKIGWIKQNFDLQGVVYDRWGSQKIIANLEEMGVEVLEMGMGFASQAPVVRELEKLILEQAIVFPDDPVLKWNFGNLICEEDAAGNRKFSKGKATEKIDLCIALCLALDGCLRNRVEVVDAAIGWL